MTHELKTWPEYFQAVRNRSKTFEVRKNDRNFHPGDTVILQEYDPITKQYTGEHETRDVGYVLVDYPALPPDYVVFTLYDTNKKDK